MRISWIEPEPPADPIDHERAALVAEIDTLRDALRRAGEDAEEAARAAYEEGLKHAADRESDRTEALGSGIEEAIVAFSRKLEAIDGLAALLARKALDKMFDGIGDRAAIVEAMLARQLRELRAGCAIAVHVAAKDFGNAADLDRLARTFTSVSTIAVDERLPAGSCRIDLKLGHLDLSVRERWEQVAAVLDELAGQATA
ncbi:hypothetical protein [Sphingomonas gilva]|nr:hypothetical protein [Sphingomonas gilva]